MELEFDFDILKKWRKAILIIWLTMDAKKSFICLFINIILMAYWTYWNRTSRGRAGWSKKIWRWFVLLIVLGIVWYSLLFSWKIQPAETVVVAKWNTIQKFFNTLSWKERMRMKIYLAINNVDTSKVEVGTYTFSWSYSPENFVKTILAGPSETYVRYTVLEWWSVYDIDADMAKKEIIQPGEFLAYVQNPETITQLSQTYSFLQQEKQLTTLEGFLYPDTYFLWTQTDPISQLVKMSLKRFDEKIYTLWTEKKDAFAQALQKHEITLSFPGSLALASVIQKEERNNKEKPTIAWIFINRLSQGIMLWADISLCYGRKEPYETCTPSLIARYVSDPSNEYNTRVHRWLPPTPISSITAETFDALLQFAEADYLFYLHDSSGGIHYGKTNAEHEANKRTYLQ